MASFLDKCEEYFGSRDFYEVLKIDKNCGEKDVKKAYHKLSLLVHPDRVEDEEKEVATEKFKVLGKIHSILQDKEKRKIYNDTGDFDEDDSESTFNWMQYWKAMFKPITTRDIDDYKESYIGSDKELRDIRKAYEGSKGDMSHILEMVAFTGPDDEPRITEIVRKMVDSGEVEEYDKFFNEPKRRKINRRRKWEREAAECDSLKLEDSDLAKQIQQRHEQREMNFMSLINSFEEKYAGKSKRKQIESGENSTPRKSRRSKK